MREPGTVQRRGGSLGPEALFRNIGSSTAGLGSGPRTSAVWRFPALWTSLNATPRDGGISAGGSRKVRGVSRAGYKDRTRGIHGHGTGFVVGRAADISRVEDVALRIELSDVDIGGDLRSDKNMSPGDGERGDTRHRRSDERGGGEAVGAGKDFGAEAEIERTGGRIGGETAHR